MADCIEANPQVNGRWTKLQHEKFLLGVQMYGKNWKKIEELVQTRTGSQIRSHAQKFFLKVKKTVEGAENDSNEHEEHDVPSSHSKSTYWNQKENSLHSVFLQHIIKCTQQTYDFDFWTTFIDTKDTKSQNQEKTVKLQCKNSSFICFDQKAEIGGQSRKIVKMETPY